MLAQTGMALLNQRARPAPATATPTGNAGKLVVVTYHFPPDPSIGGMRWHGLTKYLARLGWHSWVLTGAPVPAGDGGSARVVVESCPRRKTINDLYRFVRLGSGTAPAEPGADEGRDRAERPNGPVRWLGALRLELSLALAFPDDARGWILRAAGRARRLIARERPDVVVSSGPPHSAHLVAWLATRRTGVRWLVDLRDPWAAPVSEAWRLNPLNRSYLARWLAARLERLVMRSADGVVCNTRRFAEAVRERHPGIVVEWIPNGVDAEILPRRSAALLPGLAAVHLGTIYGGRDPAPVLEALRRFVDRHPEAAVDGPLLRLAGEIEAPQARRLNRQLHALGLEPHVRLMGVLPRDEALALAARSRLGIVLAQRQELQVPAKLYELAGIGVPTVVLAGPGSAANEEARRVGAEVIDPSDVAALERILEAAWNDGGAGKTGLNPFVGYDQLAARVTGLLVRRES